MEHQVVKKSHDQTTVAIHFRPMVFSLSSKKSASRFQKKQDKFPPNMVEQCWTYRTMVNIQRCCMAIHLHGIITFGGTCHHQAWFSLWNGCNSATLLQETKLPKKSQELPSLKLTAKGPENRSDLKSEVVFKPSIFRGEPVSFREGISRRRFLFLMTKDIGA